MARFYLVAHPTLGLPLPVENAPPEDVVGMVELDAEELRLWRELVARAILERRDPN